MSSATAGHRSVVAEISNLARALDQVLMPWQIALLVPHLEAVVDAIDHQNKTLEEMNERLTEVHLRICALVFDLQCTKRENQALLRELGRD